MSIRVEGRRVKGKPDAVSIQIGAGVFSCPIVGMTPMTFSGY